MITKAKVPDFRWLSWIKFGYLLIGDSYLLGSFINNDNYTKPVESVFLAFLLGLYVDMSVFDVIACS